MSSQHPVDLKLTGTRMTTIDLTVGFARGIAGVSYLPNGADLAGMTGVTNEYDWMQMVVACSH